MTEVAIPERPRFDARAAMPAGDFLDQVNRISIDDLMASRETGQPAGSDKNAGVASELAARREQVALLAADLIVDPKYAPLVEWMLDISLRRVRFTPGMTMEGAALFAAYREGLDNMMWQFLAAVAAGRGEPPPYREVSEP